MAFKDETVTNVDIDFADGAASLRAQQRTQQTAKARIEGIVNEIITSKNSVDKLVDKIIDVAEQEHRSANARSSQGVMIRNFRTRLMDMEQHGGFHTEYGSILISTIVLLAEESKLHSHSPAVSRRISDAIADIFRKTDVSTGDYVEREFGVLKFNEKEKSRALSLSDWFTSHPTIPQRIRDRINSIINEELQRSYTMG